MKTMQFLLAGLLGILTGAPASAGDWPSWRGPNQNGTSDETGLPEAAQAGGEQPVQREAHFALVDEADSILIDEARTPLIISALPGEAQQRTVACYQWSAAQVERFVEADQQLVLEKIVLAFAVLF